MTLHFTQEDMPFSFFISLSLSLWPHPPTPPPPLFVRLLCRAKTGHFQLAGGGWTAYISHIEADE